MTAPIKISRKAMYELHMMTVIGSIPRISQGGGRGGGTGLGPQAFVQS